VNRKEILEQSFDLTCKDCAKTLGKYFANKMSINQLAIRFIVNVEDMKRIAYQLEENADKVRKK